MGGASDKEALIITPYPGASPEEVAKEVTNPIEIACQQLGQLKRVEWQAPDGAHLSGRPHHRAMHAHG
jgi:multidrug efflux pump subunit AcrB